jgi:hypothetical protein
MLVLVALGWAVAQGARALLQPRDPGRLGQPDGRRQDTSLPAGPAPERSETTEVLTRTGDRRVGQPAPSQTHRLSPLAQREERINQLRQRYVDDEITMEQYEAELDRLMRE